MSKAERKRIRLQKSKQWLITYTGSPKNMNKHYRERFHVDALTAARDLQELGVNYTQEQLDQIKRSEEQRLAQRRKEKEAKAQSGLDMLYANEYCDDRFAYIAGYTGGGTAYGLQWEEIGIDPSLPFEEKMRLYVNGEYEIPDYDVFSDEEALQIEVLPYNFTVCKVPDYSEADLTDTFCFIGKTDGENSLVCRTDKVPSNTIEKADGWKAFRVVGTLDFSPVGILAQISGVLAEWNISIFAISTFDTDYVLVKTHDLGNAIRALTNDGYQIV